MIEDMVGIDDGEIGYIKDCVGCGFCCKTAPCDAAARLYPGAKECPQLFWDDKDNRYKCGLMTIAGPLGLAYKSELYAGAGCCSGLNTWRNDVKKRDKIKVDKYNNPLDPLFQSFLRSLGRQLMSSDVIQLTIVGMTKDLEYKEYSEREIEHIQKTIWRMFAENRNSFTEGFMP